MRTVAVIGASLAGLSAARALREQDFDGRVVVVGAEDRLPYDRPPLSKEFLAGEIGVDDLALTTDDDAGLDLEWRLGDPAAAVDPRGRSVVLASGREIAADGVVLATGARARPFPGERLGGVHTLRTLQDAVALRGDLQAGSRLVVIGAGFIGAEVASTAQKLGVEVTVIESDPLPLGRVLGAELGAACAALHEDNGVRVITGAAVTGIAGDTRVREVRLAGDRTVPADVVVAGIGALTNIEWLAGSGVDHDHRGVWTDAEGATNLPQVVAAGDCTFSHCPYAGVERRQEHWTNALQQPTAAVATLLGRSPAGTARRFVAGYRRAGELVAVFAMNQPKLFGKWRRQLTPRYATAVS
jgi:3-phenylpropionate/trans-cinnamate dioxygenase ferredoxin reductase component